MNGLCKCGCGQPTNLAPKTSARSGWIKGEPVPYIRYHHRSSSPVQYIEEDRGHDTPCWIWQRTKNQGGYGQIRIKGKLLLAHRAFYEREREPIPDGLQLDHLCRVPACVNPDHFEPVTGAENVRRGAAKLWPEAVRRIRASHASHAAWARHFGVTETCIRNARSGRRWRDVA